MIAFTLLGFMLVACSSARRYFYYETGSIPDFDEADPFLETVNQPMTISEMELKRLPRLAIHGLPSNSNGEKGMGTEVSMVENETKKLNAAEFDDIKNKEQPISRGLVVNNLNSPAVPTMKNKVPGLLDKTRIVRKLQTPHINQRDVRHVLTKHEEPSVPSFRMVDNSIYYKPNRKVDAPASTRKTLLGLKNNFGRRNLNGFRSPTALANLKTFKVIATPYTRSSWEPNFLRTIME